MNAPVTAYCSSKDRYFTTLPSCILSIINQTIKPKKFILFMDGEHIDLRENDLYLGLFKMLNFYNIEWQVVFGQKKGQVLNHQMALEIADTEWIWRCFLGKEKVETINGVKNIENIEIGDLVKTHQNRFKTVTKIHKTKYSSGKDLIKIKSANSSIKCTPEHPFLIKENSEIKWIEAKKLTTNMCLLYPYENKKDYLSFDCWARGARGRKDKKSNIKTNYKNEYFGNIEIDKDMARFFGLYLAEGCGGHDSIRFTFNNNEKEYIDFIVKICETKFNRTPTIHKRWATTIKLNIKSFNDKFTHWFDKEATIKKIPNFVFDWNIQNKLSFILGYLDGDGWKHGTGMRFGTSSKILFEDMNRLLISCGLDCTKPYEKPQKKSVINNNLCICNKSWTSSISSKSYGKILDLLNADYEEYYFKIPIIATELKKMPGLGSEKQYIYNLSVEDDNSYIVGPAIVHNCDDDTFAEPRVLEQLLSNNESKIGAVAGLVLNPNQMSEPPFNFKSTIENIETSIQWFIPKSKELIEVEHLYSTFIFKKEAASHGYCLNLSPAGHREETIFTYEMYRKGWKLIVDPKVTTWHVRQSQGGIRSYQSSQFWEHDEQIFRNKMIEWKINKDPNILLKNKKLIVLDSGKGDHIMFKMILPEIREKFKNKEIILSVCYPEIFEEELGIKLISIQEAKIMCANFGINYESFNIYKFAADNNWKRSLVDAFRKLYLEVLP